MSRVHIAPKCVTASAANTPATREVDWMNGSGHNKNASRQTDRRTEIPAFIREKNMFRPIPPKLRIFDVDLYRSFEAQKMVFGPALESGHPCLVPRCKGNGGEIILPVMTDAAGEWYNVLIIEIKCSPKPKHCRTAHI